MRLNMLPESPLFTPDRRPAIDPESLKLPSGEYANKYSLLKVLAVAGLPVPLLVSESQLADYSPYWAVPQETDLEKLMKLYEEQEEYFLYRRGFFNHPVDMWAVDTLPTNQIARLDENQKALDELSAAGSSQKLNQYLRLNFGMPHTLPVGSFLQRAVVSDNNLYFSTWSRDNNLYGAFGIRGSRGINYFCIDCDSGEIVSDSGHLGLGPTERIKSELFPLSRKVEEVCDQALGFEYEYKVDYLLGGGFKIIQVRVASKKVSDQTEHIQGIRDLLNSGIPVIEAEIGSLDALPRTPYVLRLSNDKHMGYFDSSKVTSLDMTAMRGLVLPYGLRGGLLQHNAYIFIAYALYWGLPVAVDNERDSMFYRVGRGRNV